MAYSYPGIGPVTDLTLFLGCFQFFKYIFKKTFSAELTVPSLKTSWVEQHIYEQRVSPPPGQRILLASSQ